MIRFLIIVLFFVVFSHNEARACVGPPAGVEGEIVFNSTYNVPQYCDGTDWIAMVGGDPLLTNYTPNAVAFDGLTYLNNTAWGASNPTLVTGSFWVKRNTSALGTSQAILHYRNTAGHYFRIRFNAANQIVLDGQEAGVGVYNLLVRTNTAITDNNWHHVAFSIDSRNRALDQIYINDIASIASGSATYTAFGGGNQITIGAFGAGGEAFQGSLADLWVDFDNHIDFSVEANRRKFINSGMLPVNLGTNGSKPTGTSPDLFLSNPTDSWQTNNGSGPSLTENGALTAATNNPNTPRTQIVPSGLIGHWRLDETSGSTMFDSSGNNRSGIRSGGSSTNGVVDRAINFSNDGQITLAASNSLFTSGGSFALSMWFNANTITSTQYDDRLFTAKRGNITTSGSTFFPHVYNGQLYFFYSTGTSFDVAIAPIQARHWYHVTVSYNGTAYQIYLDGVLMRTITAATTFGTVSASIGNFNGAEGRFDGAIDDVRIYNRNLNANEIQEIYRARDGIHYNAREKTMEYFDGNKFISMTPAWAEVDEASSSAPLCQNVGETCPDGTIYAGLSPDGSVPMFTTTGNAPGGAIYPWNNGNSGASYVGVMPDACYSGGEAGCITGALNTTTGAAADADDVTGGVQPHQAIAYCDSLSSNTHGDWYLPAQEELGILFANRTAGDLNGTFGVEHWTSSEVNDGAANFYDFSGSGANNSGKENTMSVRCVRKGAFPSGTSTTGLIGHWKLDETSGTTAADSSGNGLNGTTTNASFSTNSIVGSVGRGLRYNYGSRMVVPHNALLNTPNEATYALWFQYRTTQHNRLFEKASADFLIETNNNQLCAKLDSTYCRNITYTDGSWYHIAITYSQSDSSTVRFYVNGASIGSLTTLGPFVTNTSSLTIGDAVQRVPAAVDDIRIYDRALSPAEIQRIYNLGTATGISTALPQGCTNLGDVCDDGTIYGGLSPDGNIEMFSTTAEFSTLLPYNNGNTANNSTTGATSLTDGDGNTRTLVLADSDTATAGFQPHQAALYCHNLNAHGANDWYLGARQEYRVFITTTGFPAIGAFQEVLDPHSATFPDGIYRSSSEDVSNFARIVRNSQADGSLEKNRVTNVICVRKGPAPRCANPYGIEGSMVYNQDHDVVQYCDGARWIAIGKSGP